MKKLTVVLVISAFAGLLIAPNPASAGVRFGLKVGANSAKVLGEGAPTDWGTLQTKLGFCGGIFLSFNFGKIIAIQPEVLYTMKGASSEFVDPLDPNITYTGKLLFDYLEIPLLLKLKLPIGGITPFVMAGPAIGFKLNAKARFSDGTGEEPVEGLDSYDYGAILGGGLEFGRMLHLDVRYSMGLKKLVQDPDLGAIDIKNGVLSATLGISF